MKAIKIKANVVEIPFQDKDGNVKETLYFEKSDENIKNFFENKEKINELISNVNEDSDMEEAKEIVRKGYELILGEGSFDKIYALNPSIIICVGYLGMIADGILSEIMEDMRMEALDQYVLGNPHAKNRV